MNYELDFSKLTIPVNEWGITWVQRSGDHNTFELWVGDEDRSCLVGTANGSTAVFHALRELEGMRAAVKLLTG